MVKTNSPDMYLCEAPIGAHDERPLSLGFAVCSLDIGLDDYLLTGTGRYRVSPTLGKTCAKC